MNTKTIKDIRGKIITRAKARRILSEILIRDFLLSREARQPVYQVHISGQAIHSQLSNDGDEITIDDLAGIIL